ncbi:copper resistance protein CopC [Streptomyces sp. NBC_00201]|uniref:copper resistance CopC family protein n=1 Tax=Streptomyces sp. NBC_00201 TaxID=2975679 RepID=UPI00225BC011|nr:copper resistance CopC family protein [Streptomyces sp. NBC_00201]MCX5250621.1 copper resistance protein CopC [Streptomyces sp. NBC_00201]
MRRLRLLTAIAGSAACAGAVLLLVSAPAYAHTALKNAAPAPGATVAAGTKVVRLTFDNLTSGIAPTIRMIGPDGKDIPVGRPVVTDTTTACAAVSPLPKGVITLTYSITAGDGDAQSNAYQFEAADGTKPVGNPAACADLSLPAPGTRGSDSVAGRGRTTATAALAGAFAVVAGGGFLAARALRRRRTLERGVDE